MNAIVPHQPSPLSPRNFNELVEFADRAARSTMVPKDYIGKAENILIAVQMGAELGLAPMQALQAIAVINGRPSIYGDAMPALCRQSPVCDDIEEWMEGEGKAMTAFCKATRVGKKPIIGKFSVADAEKAGLWGKTGPWSQYPQRMLTWRARSWALRDAFPDVLRGLMAAEEARDIPPDTFTGPTIDHQLEQPTQPDRRAEINAEVPITTSEKAAPKLTIRDFIESLRMAVNDAKMAPDAAEKIDRLICAEDVLRAKEKFKNGALEQLEGIITDGLLFINSMRQPIDNATPEQLAKVEIEGERFAAG